MGVVNTLVVDFCCLGRAGLNHCSSYASVPSNLPSEASRRTPTPPYLSCQEKQCTYRKPGQRLHGFGAGANSNGAACGVRVVLISVTAAVVVGS